MFRALLTRRVLLVEDSVPDAEVMRRRLSAAAFEVDVVRTVAEAQAALAAHDYLVVVLDLVLDGDDGLSWAVADAARKRVPPVPVVIVTGRGNDETVAEALERNLDGYVLKEDDFAARVAATVQRLVNAADDRFAAGTLSALVQSSPDAIVGMTTRGEIFTWNLGAETIFGHPADGVIGRSCLMLAPAGEAARLEGLLARAASGEPVIGEELRLCRKDGQPIDVSMTLAVIRSLHGEAHGLSAICRDVSDRKRSEAARLEAEERLQSTWERLLEAQKMEAVGQLASGIAHDFNNLLATILGHLHMIRRRAPETAGPALDAVERAARRGTDVVRQLLGLARKSTPQRDPVDLAALAAEAEQLLTAVLDKRIRIRLALAESAPVLGDATQLLQVLLNLCLNARDAMPAGGELTIRVESTPTEAKLCVEDTGRGLTPAELERVFEPFYTTKGPGRGTGLGLAMVKSIVEAHGGTIDFQSTAGQGTVAAVRLPRSDGGSRRAEVDPPEEGTPCRSPPGFSPPHSRSPR